MAAEIRMCIIVTANVHPHSLCSTIVHVDQTVSRKIGDFVGNERELSAVYKYAFSWNERSHTLRQNRRWIYFDTLTSPLL